ncbi:HTH-type transcriptional regulator GltC [Bdellovibrio bacteriovorus]|uniref:LysR family transcriptional regulator n=1 Tax=Bdellovibrio bacteriovorus TaxID=959 RepID=UPI00045C09F0|nr:LysR family transcriptional regulator [Bdellovibrio bacteriovorus]AHZ86556.1 hypothetical protein EP01_16670 [Bdellovibrio bacteriovorus]BEV67801.1 HTH-type transcriptional regulator GltC [Bdellovibrio bacteriovorus]
MLNIHVLKSFIAVAELKSFTKAAKKVHLTQSTVSQQIKRLEEDLGCELLERAGKTATLTFEGEKMFRYAQRLCTLAEEAEQSLRLDPGHGFVRVGVPEDIASSFIAPILSEFRKKHPKIQFSVTGDLSRRLWLKYQDGELDIVLVKQKKGETSGMANWPEPLKWIDGIHSNNFAQEIVPLVAFCESGLYREEMISYLDAEERPWRLAYESSSLGGLISAVNIGFGVTLLPKRLVGKMHRVLTARQGYAAVEDFELAMHVMSGSSTLVREVAADLVRAFKVY